MIAVYRQDIQGLRALAVLAVIVFHYNKQLLSGGFVGVDVFLVISGYLITSILLQKKSTTNYKLKVALKDFYVSRIRRIAPAYFYMLIFVSVVSAILFIRSDFGVYKESLKKALYFFSNSYFANFGDYFAPGTDEQPLLHTWSLAVEMQFYLLLPFFVLIIPLYWLKKLIPIVMIVCLLAAEYMVRVKGGGQNVYYSLYARIPEFLAGSCLVIFTIGEHWGVKQANLVFCLGLLLVFASIFLISDTFLYPGLLSLLPVIGASLIISAKNASYGFLLYWPVLVWLGDLSYSLYLWHWPLLALIRYYTQAYQLDWQLGFVFVLLTFLFSITSYYWIEIQFHRRKLEVKKKSTTSILPETWFSRTASVVLFIPIIGFSKISDKLNTFFTQQEKAIEYRRYADPKEICHGQIKGDCIKGNPNASRQILVLGDSHAAMLNHFFDLLGKELDFSARIITASNCVTIPGFDYERLVKWAQKPCQEQIAYALPYIESARIVVIAGLWSSQTKSDAFIKALADFLTVMDKKDDVNIYILSQIPKFKTNIQRLIHFRDLGLFPAMINIDVAYKDANSLLQRIAKNYRNVHFTQLSELALFNQAPFYQLNSGETEILYFDEHHLNQIGAIYYATQAKGNVMEIIN